MEKTIKFGDSSIGPNSPVFIVPEAGVNHNNRLDLAKKIIEEAAKAGANAIKFQTYKAEKLATKKAPRYWSWDGEQKKEGSQYDTYAALDKLPMEAYHEMFAHAKKHKIEFLSTPFDNDSADFLEKLGVPGYKLASCDITNVPLLRHVGKKNLPMMLSTGACTLGDIERAIECINDAGNDLIILLHCTLCYPTEPKDANLNMIKTMKKAFPEYPIGISDHTLGVNIPIAAATLGARVIEKHFTVDKKLPMSSDHWLSVDPPELKHIVQGVREVEVALGSSIKKPVPAEAETYKYARRSLVANRDIKKGQMLKEQDITTKRPGTGVSPLFFDIFVGKKAQRDIKEDSILQWEDITQ